MTAIAQALSAALLHFVWQGTLLAFLLWITLSMLRNRTANQRYAASCAALALMAAVPALTAWMVYRQPGAVPISAAISAAAPTLIQASIQDAARIARESALLEWMAVCRQWALPVWSVGVLVFALRLVLGCRHVAALRRLGQAAEGQVAEAVALLARRMKAKRAIRVLISSVAESPSVVGWLRPVILLPAATLAGLEPEQLQAVLAHEIAHIRRHDYLVNLAQTMVETLLFYHPAVWWASARIRHERELCCDDAAVAICGDAISYARALTSLERLRASTPRLALGSTGGSLLYRIQRLAGVRQEMGPSKLPGIAALALGLACFATTVHWAKAQQLAEQQPIAEEWGITVSSTGEVLHRDRVPYPEATYKDGIQGSVTLEATLDQSGNVADARVLSGPPELRKVALQSVLQWQFAHGRAGETQQVSIAFQQDPREQLRHELQITLNQAHTTDEFLNDELRAAQERGDSRAIEEVQEKINRANAIHRAAGVEEHMAQLKQVGQEQDKIDTNLEILRLNLWELESKGHTQAVDSQLAQLKAGIATLEANKRDLQERMAQVIQAHQEEDQQNIAAHLAQLTQQLAEARKNLDENNSQSVATLRQLELLRSRAEGFSFMGARLDRIEIAGLPDSAKTALAARLPVRVGYILSPESVQSVLDAIREFDPRLECRFTRADTGDVTIRIAWSEHRK